MLEAELADGPRLLSGAPEGHVDVVAGLRLRRLPGVLAPTNRVSRLMAARVAGWARGTVLDLGSGSGVLAIAAARAGADVTAVDLDPRCVEATRRNASDNGVTVDARCGDLFAPVPGRRFDLVVANPPFYPPVHPGGLSREPALVAADGLWSRMVEQAPSHLGPGGSFRFVTSSWSDNEAVQAALAATGLAWAVEVVAPGSPGAQTLYLWQLAAGQPPLADADSPKNARCGRGGISLAPVKQLTSSRGAPLRP